MKKIDVVDEVAQLECSNDKFYALTYIYIYKLELNLVRTQFYYFSKMP